MTYSRAYIHGKWRPLLTTPRPILRGRNQGQLEVFVSELRKVGATYQFQPRRVKVYPDQIRPAYGTPTE